MPTYSIHHFTVAATKPEYRPRSARRIALSARAQPEVTAACRVTKQSWSSGREALRLPAAHDVVHCVPVRS